MCQRSLKLKSFSHTRGVCVAFVPAFLYSLTQLRMERENAEARIRDLEDQLAEFQDELRRETGSKTVPGEQSHQHLTVGFINFFFFKDAEKYMYIGSVCVFFVSNSCQMPGNEILSPPCACAAGPDVLSDSADGGLPAETKAGGDTEAERARADGPQGGSEGRGGQPRQGDREPARAVQQRHGEAPRQHGAGVSGVWTQTWGSLLDVVALKVQCVKFGLIVFGFLSLQW